MSQVGDQSSGCHKNFDFLSQVGDQSSGCRKNFDFFVKYVYIFYDFSNIYDYFYLSCHGGSPGSLVFAPMPPDQDPGYI